jgi:hypothetical protein
VITVKLRGLARRGLPGMWRLLKNAARLASGRWEHPASAASWEEALKASGFRFVGIETLPHEGGIAIAEAPATSAAAGARELRSVALDDAPDRRSLSA